MEKGKKKQKHQNKSIHLLNWKLTSSVFPIPEVIYMSTNASLVRVLNMCPLQEKKFRLLVSLQVTQANSLSSFKCYAFPNVYTTKKQAIEKSILNDLKMCVNIKNATVSDINSIV